VFPLYGVWNFLAAFLWRGLLAAAAPLTVTPIAWRLSILRLQSQAVNMALPFAAGVGGGALRVAATRAGGIAPAAAAAVLDDIAGGVAGLAFVALALPFSAATILDIPVWQLAIGCGAGAAILWAATVWLAPTLAARLDRSRPLGNALRVLAEHRRRLAPAFAAAVFWHVVERAITALEIWIAFMALGVAGGIPEALTIQAAIVAVSLLLFFLPGQPGAIEAVVAATCASLGLDPATGLAVAFIRRARQLLVTGLGLASFSVTRPSVVES
jgi:uncharacterized membrane protein YbhN (UPF0104 family)